MPTAPEGDKDRATTPATPDAPRAPQRDGQGGGDTIPTRTAPAKDDKSD